MEERLKTYIKQVESRVNKLEDEAKEQCATDKASLLTCIEKEKRALLTQISFFQHERLIHLIVTVLFAIMTIMAFVVVMVECSIGALVLLLLFLVLLIPYVRHYYILENGTQQLYTYYDRLEKIDNEGNKSSSIYL